MRIARSQSWARLIEHGKGYLENVHMCIDINELPFRLCCILDCVSKQLGIWFIIAKIGLFIERATNMKWYPNDHGKFISIKRLPSRMTNSWSRWFFHHYILDYFDLDCNSWQSR